VLIHACGLPCLPIAAHRFPVQDFAAAATAQHNPLYRDLFYLVHPDCDLDALAGFA
jgi:hypothetical protein